MKQAVTLARPWTDAVGVNHKPDTTLKLDREVAVELLAYGYAREADEGPAETKAPAAAAAATEKKG